MPQALLRECTYPDCHNLVSCARCPDHAHVTDAKPRGTTAERGYDHRWRKLSEWYRRRHPFCEIKTHCKGAFAVDVDHIEPLSTAAHRRYDVENLQAACRLCHNAKTRAQ